MSLLKQILETHASAVKEAAPEGIEPLIAATPQNQHKTSFSLLQNINGNEITTGDVINHLKQVDDAEEEVDTVAYGLETTDGKIVKVYVNAEEAEAFEDKMSQLLGKIDDIDQAIEELSDEFDIVKVVKPDDMESEGGEENDPTAPEVGIENQLDEPLGDDDIVTDIEDDEMVADPESEKDDKKEKKSKKNDEGEDDSEEKDPEDDLSFNDADPEADKPEGEDDSEEDKPEGEDDSEEDKPEDDSEEDDSEDDTDPEKDPKKKKPKKKPAKDDKDSKMKEEGTSILKQLLALNEAKHAAKAEKPKVKKEEPKKEPKNDAAGDDSADIFHLPLSAEEQEIEQIFANPIQRLMFRVILLLGVNAEQINIRKFKVRKSVKEVSVLIQHHPQIKNILSKLGKDLASKKNEIHTVTEAEEAPLTGTIKDQLATEISKKIYDLILALGVPEFLLTYKKTAFRNRIKNLSKIAVKHSRIKNYIYTLCDLLKTKNKGGIKEGWEAAIAAQDAAIVAAEEPAYVSKGLLEDFSNTSNYADLGTFSVTSMGEVGGTTLKVKDFSVELDDDQFEKLVGLFADGKSGVVKSENLGKINVISLARGKEYVIKKIKPSATDKYAFGVLVSKKSIDKILG